MTHHNQIKELTTWFLIHVHHEEAKAQGKIVLGNAKHVL
jgi:hypothetical protein